MELYNGRNTDNCHLPLLLTDPLTNVTAVARNKVVAIHLVNDGLLHNQHVYLYRKTRSTNVSGTVAYSGTIATFTPSAFLNANTTYTAKLTTGSKRSGR
jgi:hypothetical protein